jgi:hypothetical protein
MLLEIAKQRIDGKMGMTHERMCAVEKWEKYL